MPPNGSLLSPTGQSVVEAPAQIGRYTVEPHVDLAHYSTWYVRSPSPLGPDYTPRIEAITTDERGARKVAGALAAVDAVRKLTPVLNALVGDRDQVDSEIELDLLALDALNDALRFMQAGR